MSPGTEGYNLRTESNQSRSTIEVDFDATTISRRDHRLRLGSQHHWLRGRSDSGAGRPRYMVFRSGRRSALQSGRSAKTQTQVDSGNVARRFRSRAAGWARRQTGRSAFTSGRQRNPAPRDDRYVWIGMGRGDESQLCRTEREFDIRGPRAPRCPLGRAGQ